MALLFEGLEEILHGPGQAGCVGLRILRNDDGPAFEAQAGNKGDAFEAVCVAGDFSRRAGISSSRPRWDRLLASHSFARNYGGLPLFPGQGRLTLIPSVVTTGWALLVRG